MLRDPVCEKRINRHSAQTAIEYEGITYYLCCPLCQAEFERDPARYARPEMGQPAQRPRSGRRKSWSRAGTTRRE